MQFFALESGVTKAIAVHNYSFAGQTIGMDDGTGLQYFLTDHLGSVVATTDSTGTLISQQRYLPFGGVRPNVPTPSGPSTDLGYTGQRNLDADIGLMDYKARFYSPYLNRFIQPDSIIPNPSNPQAFNRYAYVLNRPVNFNDPTGHEFIKPCQLRGNCSSSKNGADYSDRHPIRKPNRPHRSRNANLPLSTSAGLPTNSCNANSCTGLTSTNVNPPNNNPSCPFSSCDYNFHFGNYTYDAGAMYWSGEVSAVNSINGPADSIIVISNDGGEMDHIGFDYDNSSFQVKSTTASFSLGNNSYVSYTYGSGISFKQLAINMSVDVDYSIRATDKYHFTGNTHSELGVRVVQFGLVLVSIYSGSQLPLLLEYLASNSPKVPAY